MDVEFFLLTSGFLVLFSFLYCLVFLKPQVKRERRQLVLHAPAQYTDLLSKIVQGALALILFSQAYYPHAQTNVGLVVLALVLLIFWDLN